MIEEKKNKKKKYKEKMSESEQSFTISRVRERSQEGVKRLRGPGRTRESGGTGPKNRWH